ncbi:UNVERIFIED_CONTAM: hypothetical protein NCL1_50828 [Trichonephila clavipes]
MKMCSRILKSLIRNGFPPKILPKYLRAHTFHSPLDQETA